MKAQEEKLVSQPAAPPSGRAQDGHTTLLTGDPAAAPPSTATAPPNERARTRGRRRAFLIFFVVLLIIGAGALLYWLHERQFEDTDDAQVEMHLNPISARIDGTITKVYVEENQTGQGRRSAGGSGSARSASVVRSSRSATRASPQYGDGAAAQRADNPSRECDQCFHRRGGRRQRGGRSRRCGARSRLGCGEISGSGSQQCARPGRPRTL